MIAVLFGFIVITSIAFFVPSMLMKGSQELNASRGIGAASITAIIYVIVVAVIANG